MKNLFDVMKLLKRFGIYIYTGDRKADIGMMQSEVKDLFDNGLVTKEEYIAATLVLREEMPG
ncbi:YqgQ family protein [Sporosarcina sp. 179-K 3D1 HS]|uniref:YqgQ family protein n=1 Tax=Sporosarcina sp. 179-K 3D1 HS TaxID=3232169 RepID=UPI0039A2B40B